MEYTSNGPRPDKAEANDEVSLRDLLDRIDIILQDKQSITEAIKNIGEIADDDENIVGEKATNIRLIVERQEETKRKALDIMKEIALLSVKK